MSERISPLAGACGSAEFVRALATGLIGRGHDARVALPAYAFVENDARYNVRPVLEDVAIHWEDGSTKRAYVQTCSPGGIPVYLVGGGGRFRRDARLDGEADCVFFAKGVQAALMAIRPQWLPDVVHINDSCPGLAAVYLNALYLREWAIGPAALVTTVHGGAEAGRVNTLVTGSGLDPDVRVIRRYRSPRRLADAYEHIYSQALAPAELRALAA